ncbi:hypothetical protein ACFX2I_022513 [Malus domestica]|uniref:uncharacterized protein At3g49055-like n=1 Tax=Malus domestica TaxID=3750 RepID=UPI0010AAE0EB|nr:uncharacterized protein At3g49055-like [Malus domestica]
MENPTETLPDPQINSPDPPNNPEASEPDHVLLAELDSLCQLHQSLLSKAAAMEEESNIIRKQRDDALARNVELIKVVGEISGKRDSSRRNSKARRFSERKGRREGIIGIIDGVGDEKAENGAEEAEGVWEESAAVARLAASAEAKVSEYKELRKKEKELEKSVVSLTEKNRDISSLLRVALVEKEAVEKKLKGNSEQKRVALLHIAERGLQKVGFGFIMERGR